MCNDQSSYQYRLLCFRISVISQIEFLPMKNIIITNMRILSFLRSAITMNDLFYSSEMLRYEKQLEYKSFTGGLLSLGIIIAVIIGFASMIINTLTLNSISFIQNISKLSTPTSTHLTTNQNSKFMMAVELWGVNMSQSTRTFDVLMIQLNTSSGQKNVNYSLIPMESCTRDHWAAFPQISAQFDELSMKNWLCPPLDTAVHLSGDFSSNLYQYVNISVNPCISWLNPHKPCASKSDVQAVFDSFNDAIRFKIYYTNPLINAGKKDYKSYYLQSSNYINFGATIGGESFLHVADYQVTTDYSIWPYSQYSVDKGILIENQQSFHPYTTMKSTYASYYIVKSSTKYSYQRVVQKISNVFSFIGGLISAISAALFILKFYNTLAFEIALALCIFKPPENADFQCKNMGMNVFVFIKFYAYKILKKIKKKPQWPEITFLDQCQKEIVNQLDVKALIKRIIFLQYCMTNLFEDYQLEGLQIKKPKTPEDICKIRQKCESLDVYQQHQIFLSDSKLDDLSSQCQSNFTFIDSKISNIDMKNMNEIATPVGLCEKIVIFEQQQQQQQNQQPANFKFAKNQVQPFCENDHQKFKQIVPSDVRLSKKKEGPIQNEAIQLKSILKRKSINLSILRKNAEQGNTISKKIWHQFEAKPSQLNPLKPRHKIV